MEHVSNKTCLSHSAVVLRLGARRVYFIKQSVLLALRVFLVLCVGTCFAAEQCYLSTLAHAAQ